MKRGGAGNPLGENAVLEDMKQEDEKGWSRRTLSVKRPFLNVFEDMKQEDEKGWSR